MDNLLLEAAVLEMRREAVGLPVHRLVPEGRDRLMLLLGDGWGSDQGASARRRLHVGIEAGGARLHLTRRRAAPPSPPTPFQGLVGRELDGSVLRRVCKARWERVVVLEFVRGGDDRAYVRRLAAELFGAHGNLWWLDGDDRILGFARTPSTRRGLRQGARWESPDPGTRLDPERVGERAFRGLVGDAGAGLARRLARGIQGMSPALCAALERRAASGDDPWPAFQVMVEAVVAGRFEACLYEQEISGTGSESLLSPLPVAGPPGSMERRFASVGEALDAWGASRDRAVATEARRRSLGAEVRREAERLARLEARLAADLAREDEVEDLTRRGNVLLAGLHQAQVEGDRATVPDPFDPEGRPVTLTIDPRRSLQENADRLFHRARKARRGRKTVALRLAEVRSRLPALREAIERLERVTTTEQIASLEESLSEAGVLRLVRRPDRRKAAPTRARAPQVLPIRVYRSADGMEILLGRTGKANDTLTFQVASPQDFWLHAQGWAGAHVVVRNPKRLGRLPRATLEQAAQLAALHSKARGGGRVEVMVTQRRHVKKGRNLPPGAVRVRRHESVKVAPRMPFPEEV